MTLLREGFVVQAALLLVLKESFKIYKAISEGLINLADKFFEMDYLSAQKGLEIYRQSIMDSERLQVASAAFCILLLKTSAVAFYGRHILVQMLSSFVLFIICKHHDRNNHVICRPGWVPLVDAVQAYYREVEQIDDLKRAIQFPKLEPPPADFLVQMDNYAKEAPRSLDDNAAKKVS